jgi:threonine/homoserine/homoserine lactone efflux protein
MTPHLYLAIVGASVALMLTPGPNVALIVANSAAHGRRCGLLTVAGTTFASAVHLVVLAFGMAALMALVAQWFEWPRWLGVAYLVWLGIRAWRAARSCRTK